MPVEGTRIGVFGIIEDGIFEPITFGIGDDVEILNIKKNKWHTIIHRIWNILKSY